MTSRGKKLGPRAVAVVLVVAMLNLVGVSTIVMMFLTAVVLVIWLLSQRSQRREVERIFEFYAAADAILREEDRRWYGFEIAEVIDTGEHLLEAMPDSPPLHLFALGGLYYRIGKYEATAEYLSHVIENEHYNEQNRVVPSPQLRRYVEVLRRIENEPSLAPQTLAAIRSLERMRGKHAIQMLAESRSFLKIGEVETPKSQRPEPKIEAVSSSPQPLKTFSTPPPIAEVLHDIYHDDAR
jgi:hypothetical protein